MALHVIDRTDKNADKASDDASRSVDAGRDLSTQQYALTVASPALYPVDTVLEVDEKTGLSVSWLLLLGLAGFLIWAASFEIDQSVRATGAIIPSARTQIIQAADGGVLAQLLVREGEFVDAEQSLAVLEKERVSATYEESRAKAASIKAALIRARSEISGDIPDFGELRSEYPDFAQVQRALFLQRRESLSDELTTHRLGLDMAQEELRMSENLFATGDASRLEVMRARRQVSEIAGKLSGARNTYLQKVHEEITKLEADLVTARHKLDERKSVLEHTEIRAPVAGIIKYLRFNTLGGVLRAGDELMQISPTQGGFVIEIRINPVDIGQLKVGMPVSIKLDAFDYAIHGNLEGTLSYISADTLTEKDNDRSTTSYVAQVLVDEDFKNRSPKFGSIDLKPGMTAMVDIRTGARTVLEYLIKPVSRAFGGALNER